MPGRASRSRRKRCSAGRRCRRASPGRWSPSSAEAGQDRPPRAGRELQLDAEAARRAPNIARPSADLLSHRLGLYRNAYDNKLEEGQDPRFLRQTLAQLNLICQPGSCWSYQNVAFDAASEIVARQTRLTYADTLKQQLFAPIGMTSASSTMQGLVTAKSWARPHNAGRKRVIELTDTYYRVPAAGGVNSNIKDLSLWMLAQMGADARRRLAAACWRRSMRRW